MAVKICGIRRTTADGIARRLTGRTLAEGERKPFELWDEIAGVLEEHLVPA